MKLYPINTLIELGDGRRGRVVYNGLDGQGINLREAPLSQADLDLLETTCPIFPQDVSHVPKHLFPKVMLRNPYPNQDMECVSNYWEVEE